MKYTFLLIFTLLIVASCQNEKHTNDKANTLNPKIFHLMDSLANEMILDTLIRSTSIGLVYDGQVYINHYGELETGKGNTPTDKTIYEIGSLSKVFSGTLMARAVLEKKVNLEDDVTLFLEGEYPNLAYGGQPIRIKHLLTHTSGMPNILPLELNPIIADFLDYNTPAKMNEMIAQYSKSQFLADLHSILLDTVPGSNYSYSNAGTELTAHILEQVYDIEYSELLSAFLKDKIQIKNTKLTLNKLEAKNLAVGYHVDNPKIAPAMAKLPWGSSGNMKSTVPDMTQFIRYQLANDSLVQESHKTLYQKSDEDGIGYFWRIDFSDKEAGPTYLHHGGVPRSQCYIVIQPQDNLGLFIITNQSGKNTSSKMIKVLNELLQEVPKD